MMNVTDEKTKSRRLRIAAGATQVRARVAQLVWLVCLACALVLAAGALLIALDANQATARTACSTSAARTARPRTL